MSLRNFRPIGLSAATQSLPNGCATLATSRFGTMFAGQSGASVAPRLYKDGVFSVPANLPAFGTGNYGCSTVVVHGGLGWCFRATRPSDGAEGIWWASNDFATWTFASRGAGGFVNFMRYNPWSGMYLIAPIFTGGAVSVEIRYVSDGVGNFSTTGSPQGYNMRGLDFTDTGAFYLNGSNVYKTALSDGRPNLASDTLLLSAAAALAILPAGYDFVVMQDIVCGHVFGRSEIVVAAVAKITSSSDYSVVFFKSVNDGVTWTASVFTTSTFVDRIVATDTGYFACGMDASSSPKFTRSFDAINWQVLGTLPASPSAIGAHAARSTFVDAAQDLPTGNVFTNAEFTAGLANILAS